MPGEFLEFFVEVAEPLGGDLETVEIEHDARLEMYFELLFSILHDMDPEHASINGTADDRYQRKREIDAGLELGTNPADMLGQILQ